VKDQVRFAFKLIQTTLDFLQILVNLRQQVNSGEIKMLTAFLIVTIYILIGIVSHRFWALSFDETDMPSDAATTFVEIALWPVGWYFFFKAAME
jgi:hypothetical protein